MVTTRGNEMDMAVWKTKRLLPFFFLMNRRPPRSTLFPYPTLFRSRGELALPARRAERPPRTAVLAGLARGDVEFVALGRGAVVDPRRLVELVGPEAPPARPAVDHGIGEVIEVTARLPDARVHQDRRVQTDHVGPEVDVVAPPHALDVVLQLDAERAVIPARGDAAINLARLEDEAPALAERDDQVQIHRLASPAAAARTTTFIDSPCLRLRLALAHS